MTSIFLVATLTHWIVPATGEEQFLADRDPVHATKGGVVRIVAAQGEYEPASFVLKSDVDLGKVRLEVGDLALAEGRATLLRGRGCAGAQPSQDSATATPLFPKTNLDLKVVKVWYQNRNGWFCYFGDTGFKLCPELLLNDEDLIRVDTAKEANYARVECQRSEVGGQWSKADADGNYTWQWINPPRKMDTRSADWRTTIKSHFQSMRPGFQDAKTLQPVALAKDVRKQFYLTVHVPEGTPAGVYQGEITLWREGGAVPSCDGTAREGGASAPPQSPDNGNCVEERLRLRRSATLPAPPCALIARIPIQLRVLGFSLPRPKTHFNPDKDFLITAFNYLNLDIVRELNGGDLELAKSQFKAVLADEARHGVQFYPIGNCGISSEADFYIRTMQEVGMRTDILRGGARALRSITWKGHDPKLTYADMVADAKKQADYYDRTLGHHNVYVFHGDEPPTDWIAKERPLVDAYHEGGLKYFIACHRALFHKGGHVWDFNSTSKISNDDSTPRLWNQMDNAPYVGWYGHMHVGNENPAMNRRQNGLAPYLSGYSALCNYAFHLGPYNDDSETYKPMVNAYGTADGVIGTLQWEGFREGVDDIRYATLLTALARKALKATDYRTQREGKKALHYMAELQMGENDYIGTGADPLDTVRLEMIAWIEKLRVLLGAAGTYEEKPIIVKKFVGECTDPLGGKQDLFGDHGYVRFGDWTNMAACADKTLANKRERPHAVKDDARFRSFLQGYIMTGRRADAIALCRLEKRYEFVADLLEDKKPTWNADPKKAQKEIDEAGSFMLLVGNEAKVRELVKECAALVKPRERKIYPVAFSTRTLSGLGDWANASVKPETQKLDRKFGGNMDFLVTDITSGNRGADVGKDKNAKGETATMQILCDSRGLHFRFDEKNPDAEAMSCRAKAGGSFECYLAPGENQPYVSFMPDQGTGRYDLFNTTYDTYGIRAVPRTGQRASHTEVSFADGVASTYVFIPWDSYAQLVPHDGDEWEFEAVFWNKRGGECWNGTESIHGRSTWGRLKFAMPEAARAAILKRQLFLAKQRYEREKVTWDSGVGVIDFWKDPDLGDADFYAAKVAPLVERLDAAAKALTMEIGNEEIFRYEREVLPQWMDIRFILADLRRDWLLEK